MKFQRLASSAILLLTLFCATKSLTAQDAISVDKNQDDYLDQYEPQERVRLNIDLSDQDLNQLKRDGRLRMRIPEYYKNRVAAILLRHVDTYRTEKVRVSGEPQVIEDASQVRIGELMVERLRYQPIEFRVFEKNFSEVEICYIAEPQTKIFVADEDQGLTREEYQIQIMDRFHLNAKISKFDKLKLETAFGVYTIRWEDVARIQFGEFGTASAKLFLDDGSAVSGRLEIETLDIKTRWGKITIPANDLSSISR